MNVLEQLTSDYPGGCAVAPSVGVYPVSYGRPPAIVADGNVVASAASFSRCLRAANLTPATRETRREPPL